ncbi:MAG TPA: hypothetical protein PLQ20_00415 [Candidatus Paceibacterota bacterium]|jgi:hypothetical protein|nr:hypothetical protein [Candidatus Paceibacterota bacterium]
MKILSCIFFVLGILGFYFAPSYKPGEINIFLAGGVLFILTGITLWFIKKKKPNDFYK